MITNVGDQLPQKRPATSVTTIHGDNKDGVARSRERFEHKGDCETAVYKGKMARAATEQKKS